MCQTQKTMHFSIENTFGHRPSIPDLRRSLNTYKVMCFHAISLRSSPPISRDATPNRIVRTSSSQPSSMAKRTGSAWTSHNLSRPGTTSKSPTKSSKLGAAFRSASPSPEMASNQSKSNVVYFLLSKYALPKLNERSHSLPRSDASNRPHIGMANAGRYGPGRT